MVYRFSLKFLLLISALICYGPLESLNANEGSRQVSDRNENAVLNYLRPLSSSSDKGIRLYYLADCHPIKNSNLDSAVPFPFTKVRPPSKGKTGVEAVREMFANNKNVKVTEDQSAIRIWIGQVPTEFLHTKLLLLRLDPWARYNHTVAVRTLKESKEVDVAARALGISLLSGAGGTLAQPQEGLPHLPALAKDVTVDHVLDLIARTFHEVVLYGACSEPTTPEGEKFVWID